MNRVFFLLLSLLTILPMAGCAGHRPNRNTILSEELPLTIGDIAEIRNGEKNHEKVLWEYREYQSPKLQKYCNTVAKRIADVSTRPNLPYRVILLDSPEVNVFGGPGGYIYMTRGFFDFIDSEPELAGAIAHEITHVANYEYSGIPQVSRVTQAYGLLVKGADLASSNGVGGPYASGAVRGLRLTGMASSAIAKRYGHDQEIETDKVAVDILVQANYDPRGYVKLVDKLSRIEMDDVGRFAIYLNTHPPFQDRRVLLEQKISKMKLDASKFQDSGDVLSDIRRESVNAPDSIVFQPEFAAQSVPSVENQSVSQQKKDDLIPDRSKRWSWF